MPNYAFTGGLGAGKTLCAVGRARTYLISGRRVATNLDIFPEKFLPLNFKDFRLTRFSDYPTVSDLNALGRGHYVSDGKGGISKDEKHNGALILDECNVFFNPREWADKSRVAVIAWLRHARKLGWDCFFIMQDIDAVDKQIRKGLIEHEGVCKRTDRLSIPFLGGLLRFLGLGFLSRPPRIHVCSVKYGISHNSQVVDRWFYRGVQLQDAYDTNQIFVDALVINKNSDADDVREWSNQVSLHSVLSPWHVRGRHESPGFFVLLSMWWRCETWRPYRLLPPPGETIKWIMSLPVSDRVSVYNHLQRLGRL